MYRINEKVRYSDVNAKGQLPLYKIMDYLQECSTTQSEELGVGVKFMTNSGKGWVITSYKIKILAPINQNQEITIGTAPTEFKGLFATRKFCIMDKEGNNLVVADTKWIIIDLKTRKPERIKSEYIDKYPVENIFLDVVSNRKLFLSGEKYQTGRYKVLKTYIDSNGHMNNANYLRVAEECIPKNFEIKEADIVFNNEAKYNDTLISYIHKEEEGIGISIEDEDGKVFTTIKLK